MGIVLLAIAAFWLAFGLLCASGKRPKETYYRNQKIGGVEQVDSVSFEPADDDERTRTLLTLESAGFGMDPLWRRKRYILGTEAYREWSVAKSKVRTNPAELSWSELQEIEGFIRNRQRKGKQP